MAEEKSKGDINFEYNQAIHGLNMDLTPSQIDKGSLTYALNAALENYDASGINYQNEPGNELCLTFPQNYVLIGSHFIQERHKHIFFLANPITHGSEIGYMDNNDCIYKTLINDPCLNFDINRPIPKIVHKTTNCTTELYWPDNNGRRFLDIDNIPYMLSPNSDVCNPSYTDKLDCNQINMQPTFAIPQVKVTDVRSGGNIIAGTVQFAFQYGDALGNPFTSYFSVTNPTPIADPSLITVNFNYPVGKSVVVSIANIETSGKFQYFNLAVIKTVNDITSVELVGTYFIDGPTKEITYSGQNQSLIRLTINDIFERFPIYDVADDVTTVQDVLVWAGLSSAERINYQSIASKIKLFWETWRIPPGENYSDELNATHLRGYLRDEVYAFEFVPILKNGKQTDGFHIPGREMFIAEKALPMIDPSNPDYIEDPKEGAVAYWRIYNTATNRGKVTGYSPDVAYKGPYEYGDFSYWESEDEYPCDEAMWGDLAGKRIRHHKFPDVEVSPIFESKVFSGLNNMTMGDTAIFPIGVHIDVQQIKDLIAESDLTDEQKLEIVGFKIARANRGTNKSVVAKGILRNVGKYRREEQDFYFPNYPYNDLNADPFLNAVNNAYSAQCESFTVEIKELNVPATASTPAYTRVKYIDCNTNKEAFISYNSTGVKPNICSIGKPVLMGATTVPFPGCSFCNPKQVAAIGYTSYDVWSLQSGGSLIQNCQEFKVKYEDYINGPSEAYVPPHNFGGPGIKYIKVVPGTVPFCSDNCDSCGKEIFHKSSEDVRNNACSTQVPQEAIPALDPTIGYRQVFNSPETSFGQPFLGDILKLESVIYGKGDAHFVQVKDNAKYRLLTEEAQRDALDSAKAVGNITNPNNGAAMFTIYQSYLTIYINGITKKNFAYSFNSRASYDYTVAVPDDQGIKQRRVDLKKYLIPVIQNVGEEDIDINNYQRETSVYLRTEGSDDGIPTALPFPHESPLMLSGPNIKEYSRFTIGCTEGVPRCTPACATPANEQQIEVVSYYASMKNIFRNQYGQLFSYETIDTGFQRNFNIDEGPYNTIFGGDTFISRFAFKTKLPFFIDNRVGAPDESDIFYDELGNIAYPKFWHSARSILKDYTVGGNLGVLTNIISYKAHNFDCPNSQDVPKSDPNRTFYDGYFYLFAYGIPNFYVESSYNVDLRQAFNNKEGEFWPHVSSGIPDDWVQESFVSIQNDNTYNYNVTYSKQNKETFFSHLPVDFQDKECFTVYPFRAIYSDAETANAENRVNNWLTYRAIAYFDFPQNYGLLTSIDGIENRQLLVRFENKSLLYNALYTTQTNTQGQVYLGQPLFSPSSPPLDFAETDLGYIGSQHKFLLKIPQGQISIDAKRGQVFVLNGNQAKDISAPGTGMNRFFTDHLAFEILRFFPNYEVINPVTKERTTILGVDVDNHFKGIGLHGVYDSKFDRIIITKLDYIPLSSDIKYNSITKEFYIEELVTAPMPSTTSTTTIAGTTSSTTTVAGSTTTTTTGTPTKIRKVVEVTDPEYFCNKSWTLSFSFVTNSWISFHSYLPNWYIGENNFFYTGIRTCCDDIDFSFIAGPLVPDPSTTTTSTTFGFPATTSTTTSIGPSCGMDGGSVVTPACAIEGTGVITTPPIPPACERPANVINDSFVTGYTVDPNPPVVTTASSGDACAGITFLRSNPAIIQNTPVQYVALVLNRAIYLDNGTTDCTSIPNGWYYNNQSITTSGSVYHVENGVVTEILGCFPTTTTTTTNCNLRLYDVSFYNCVTCTFMGTGTIGNSEALTEGKYYFDPVTGFKMLVDCFTGCGTGTDRTIAASSAKDNCPSVICPA